MSSLPAAELSKIITYIQNGQTDAYCAFVALTLLAFEWSLTLSREVELYWKGGLTVAKVLFFWNRYLPIVVLATGFFGTTGYTDQSCNAQIETNVAFEYLQYVPWAVFATMRAYALGGRRWYLAACTLFFSSMPFILGWPYFRFDKYAYISPFGCLAVRTPPPAMTLAREPYTIELACPRLNKPGDMHVRIPPLIRTVRLEGVKGKYNSFSMLFLVNGTVYFVTLCTLNTLQLAFTLCTIGIDLLGADQSYFVYFVEPITALLVSRFLLQLQEVKRRNEGVRSLGEMSSLNFDRIVGCLSSALEPDDVWAGDEIHGEEMREDASPGQESELIDRTSVP